MSREEVPMWWNEGDVVCLRDEHWVDLTFQAREDVGTEIVDRADEVLGSHEKIREEESHDDSADPCANETCDKLVS